jgi:hypothetical protein
MTLMKRRMLEVALQERADEEDEEALDWQPIRSLASAEWWCFYRSRASGKRRRAPKESESTSAGPGFS